MPGYCLSWLLQELIEANPAIWMLSVDGFIVDVRDLPLEIQQEAARRGLIPYVPEPRHIIKQTPNSTAPAASTQNEEGASPNPSVSLDDPLMIRNSLLISLISMTVFGQSDSCEKSDTVGLLLLFVVNDQ